MHWREAIEQGIITEKELVGRMPLILCGNHGKRLTKEQQEKLLQLIWESMEKEATDVKL